MEVISIYFPVFAIISVFIYYLLNNKYRILFLFVLSCAFIASLSLNLLFYILGYSLFNFFLGLKIPGSHYKKAIFRTGIIINIVQIILLKYYGFTVGLLFELFGFNQGLSHLSDIIIPIGISYFTLQAIGYLINVYMGWEKPERNLLNFLLYISFYPKFLSGPIERSNHLLPQFMNLQPFENGNVMSGLKTALWGFFKKLIIADQLGSLVNNFYANPENEWGSYIWLVIIIQPLYLYFDFSGYTDIAIGFARMYGINLLQNFNRPFLSENVTTFWKRFHISLSLWFNDYVFKQSSYKLRKLKSYAAIIAVFITWILFGIWHGAGWNFMILGLAQAVAIIYEYYTKKQRTIIFSKLPECLKIWSGRIFTFLFFGFSLTFFFSPDLRSAFHILSKVLNISNLPEVKISLTPLLFGLIFALIYLTYEILQNDYQQSYNKIEKFWNHHKSLRIIIYYTVTFLIISQLSGSSSFVYQIF